MILLVTTSSRARECAAALEQGTGQPTQVANSVPLAVTRLETTEYDALAIDQSLLEADFRALDTLLNHAGTALPIYVNLALHHCDRVVREAQVALRPGRERKAMGHGLGGADLAQPVARRGDRHPADLGAGVAAGSPPRRGGDQDSPGAEHGGEDALAAARLLGLCLSELFTAETQRAQSFVFVPTFPRALRASVVEFHPFTSPSDIVENHLPPFGFAQGRLRHRDTENKGIFFFTTEDTGTTEFLLLFLLRALRVLCGDNILLCASVSLWLIFVSLAHRHHQQPAFGHVLDGVAQPFAAQA